MQTELTLIEFAMIMGLIWGFILGLIPLILGFVKKNIKFGLIGFVLSLIAGWFLALFGALPVAAVFVWLILRKPAETKPVQNETVSEDQTAVSVKDAANSPVNQTSGD